MTPSNVLITGGAGFVGRALVGECLRQGHNVAIIDNLCAGTMENIKEFSDQVSFREIDILDAARVRATMEEVRPEIVFHLAAHHFIPFCNAHPQDTLRVNAEGSYVVLSEAARAGTAVAVLASSGALYPSREDTLKEDLAVAPVDVYGLSKQLMEQTAQFISTTSSMSCVAARLFNVYGPFETNPHLIPDIIAGLRVGRTLHLGNIHTKRDYIHVDDVAALLCKCAKLPRAGFLTVNIGTGVEYSAGEIVETIASILQSGIEIQVDASRKRAVDKLFQRADTDKLKSLIGATARVSLSEGLERLLDHEGLISSRQSRDAVA